MKPEAGVGRGTAASWLASAMLNWVNSAWKALLKWAECVLPSGRRAWLSTLSPPGPNSSGISSASLPESWAEPVTAPQSQAPTASDATTRLIESSSEALRAPRPRRHPKDSPPLGGPSACLVSNG